MQGTGLGRDALMCVRNRLSAAYHMSVVRSKNARQVVLLWIELLGMLVCGDAMGDAGAGSIPSPEMLSLLWEGFDGVLVDDVTESSRYVVILADEAKDEAKDAAKTTATAAEEEAREAGKAFQGLKYFLEYGVKESVSAAGAASGAIPCKICFPPFHHLAAQLV